MDLSFPKKVPNRNLENTRLKHDHIRILVSVCFLYVLVFLIKGDLPAKCSLRDAETQGDSLIGWLVVTGTMEWIMIFQKQLRMENHPN